MIDTLFARPKQPASAPRVSAFAELALKEIYLGVGSDSNLLADKQAFSEFMDKVNESVLLGLRKPPSAASVIIGDKGDFNQQTQDAFLEKSFDINKDKPLSLATAFETRVSGVVSAPRRHHRRGSSAGYETMVVPTPSFPKGPHRVRFHASSRDEWLNPSQRTSSTEEEQHQKRGSGVAEEEKNPLERARSAESTTDARLRNYDFDGPNLLQELRRLRSKALADANTNHNSTPFPPSQEARSSVSRSSPPSTNVSRSSGAGDDGATEWLSQSSPPSPLAALPYKHRTSCLRENTSHRRGGHSTTISVEREGMHTTVEIGNHGGRGGDQFNSIENGLAGAKFVEEKDGSGGYFDRGPTQSVAHCRVPRVASVSDGSVDGAAAVGTTIAGHQGRSLNLGRGGRHVRKRKTECSDGRWDGRAEQQEEGFALDLSDCSSEKLGTLLKQGRRRG